jgi:hypothetical protein
MLLAGCRGAQSQVSGTVSYENVPLASGTVMAVGKDGVPHYGAIAANGQYKIEGLPAGSAICAVTSPDPNAVLVQRPRGSAPSLPSPDTAPPAAGKWFAIPDRYSATSLSKLQCELQPGANQFDIKLTK